ncbi:MAG: 50S ribosomal protein L11 methyltransferase, partial [Candidatus Binatia bacterium]
MQGWLELAVTVPAEAADAVGNHLIEIGAPGIIEEEIAGAPARARLRAHFPEAIDRAIPDEVRSFLASLDPIFPGCAAAAIELSRVAAEDWAEGWKRDFPPLEVGRSLRVRPPWGGRAEDGRHDVEILPAMAFGTGQHASTLGCLLALDDLAARGTDLSSVLDVGTGSGILAIAAARLGA